MVVISGHKVKNKFQIRKTSGEPIHESNKTQVETVNFDFISKSPSDRMKYNILQSKYIEHRERASIQHVGGKFTVSTCLV